MFIVKEDKGKKENQSPNRIAKSIGEEHNRNGKRKQ